MSTITVWTKQHASVLETLEKTGRYAAKRDFVALDLGEHAPLVLEAYDWLVAHHPDAARRPADAGVPVWVSFEREATMLPGEGSDILELSVDPGLITPVNISKWGAILNYSYIPRDAADAARHRALLEAYGVSDVKAVMTQFYPQIRREIVESWSRLFDPAVSLGSDACYGLLWEVRLEWLRGVTQ